MDITFSYVLLRFIIGVVICIGFGLLQGYNRHFNFIYILLGFFIGGGLYCLITENEILYILITIYFVFSTATVLTIRLIQFIKQYRKKQSGNKSL